MGTPRSKACLVVLKKNEPVSVPGRSLGAAGRPPFWVRVPVCYIQGVSKCGPRFECLFAPRGRWPCGNGPVSVLRKCHRADKSCCSTSTRHASCSGTHHALETQRQVPAGDWPWFRAVEFNHRFFPCKAQLPRPSPVPTPPVPTSPFPFRLLSRLLSRPLSPHLALYLSLPLSPSLSVSVSVSVFVSVLSSFSHARQLSIRSADFSALPARCGFWKGVV